MKEISNGLGRIVIPPEHNPFMTTQIIDVHPTGDDWLVDKNRKLDETVRVVRARSEALQRIFEEEFSVKPDAARLLALIEMNSEYSRLTEEHKNASSGLRSVYEDQKKQIRAKSIASTKQEALIKAKWGEYEPQIIQHSRQAEKAERLQKLVLRNAVLDTFSFGDGSQKPLIINLSETIDEVRRVQSQFSENFGMLQNTEAIDGFVVDLTNYLDKANDDALFSKYNYRRSENLVSVDEDCRVLGSVLEIITNPEIKEDKLEQLGSSYLKFLLKRANYLASTTTNTERYPYLSLMHDVAAVSLHGGKAGMTVNLEGVMNRVFGSVTNSPNIKNEVKRFMANQSSGISQLEKYIVNTPEQIKKVWFDAIENGKFSMIPEAVIIFCCSTEQRLLELGELFGSINTTVGSKLAREMKRNSGRESEAKFAMTEVDRRLMSLLYTNARLKREIKKASGIEVDLGKLWVINSSFFIEMDVLHEASRSKSTNGKLMEPVIWMPDGTFRTISGGDKIGPEESLRIERRNRILWREVLDGSMWFVSPRGDRFSEENDQELLSQGVQSITFKTESQYPREHKAICRLGNGVEDVYWLGTNNNLLDENRKLLSGDPRVIGLVTDLLLRRLYYITSGILSQKEDVEQKEEGLGGIKFEYRRAHYRIIKSTSGRRITMESRSAITHAREILEDYGINIFKEIERRREAGTLKPDEFLTFVREVSPSVVGENVLPNEIVFDPNLLTIPSK